MTGPALPAYSHANSLSGAFPWNPCLCFLYCTVLFFKSTWPWLEHRMSFTVLSVKEKKKKILRNSQSLHFNLLQVFRFTRFVCFFFKAQVFLFHVGIIKWSVFPHWKQRFLGCAYMAFAAVGGCVLPAGHTGRADLLGLHTPNRPRVYGHMHVPPHLIPALENLKHAVGVSE